MLLKHKKGSIDLLTEPCVNNWLSVQNFTTMCVNTIVIHTSSGLHYKGLLTEWLTNSMLALWNLNKKPKCMLFRSIFTSESATLWFVF